ncbi:deaminase [Niastella koreensis]|uniref:Bifunctional deaminase-reductase domain protein n=2 Tax=Niastella koreensis TaxID=354356 RepID=G8TBC4_NIAKG|nr:dihydrofolate reductase family protein [Niastella koreensis]AEW03424.1 bifunctional deaminase-reductase domain protein [Niastella koreensis GR20-10]OQP53796.1 deaminase [Niastella koreensis]
MRKVIVSMNVTLDGFMAGPDCGLDWHFKSWNEEMARATAEQLSRADTILLGGITYRGMAQYWNSNPVNLIRPREDLDFASMLNSYPKVVFSKSMTTVSWNNARLAKREIEEEVVELKHRDGKDMIVYGSGKIVATLTKLGLVDEFRMWVHPVVIGCGKPVFKELVEMLDLQLVKTEIFSSGVVILCYTVK